MTDEEKEAIEDLKLQIEQDKQDLPYSEECIKNNQIILNLLSKKDKVIDMLADICFKLYSKIDIYTEVEDLDYLCIDCKYEDEDCNRLDCIERLKEYIIKKVEEENE